MHNFTLFAVQLNEQDDKVAPTDSRRRPDQRLMEENNWDQANEEKLRLEGQQRAKRNARESEYMPTWFKRAIDSYTNETIFTFSNEYWECKAKQNWHKCPSIF